MRLKEFIQFGQSGWREGSLFIGREATETFGQVAAQAGPTAEFLDLAVQCLSFLYVGRHALPQFSQFGCLEDLLFFKFLSARSRRTGINRDFFAEHRQFFLVLVDLCVK